MTNYGEYLRSIRQQRGLTLREVEAQAGVSNAYLSQLENGKVKQPSPSNLYKLAELYNVTYEDLMERVGYPVPKAAQEPRPEKPMAHNRLGKLSSDEEEELIDYLSFIRNRKKR
ncbi:MAG TPA: XRE family transcriptional regulator [Bacteroidetes bacterium]|nr:XRE family transcriptional regulator [Bacteroidota bacterium]